LNQVPFCLGVQQPSYTTILTPKQNYNILKCVLLKQEVVLNKRH
jgi:hypothetical protein